MRLQRLPGQHLISLQILPDGLLHDIPGERPVIAGVGLQPVAGELLVKGGLSMSGLIAVGRPEAGAVRGQHFITQNNIAVLVQTEFEFGVGDDDAAGESVVGTLLVEGQGAVLKLSCVLLAPAGKILLQMGDTLLIGDVFVVVADFGFGGGGVDGLRKLVRFLKTLRQRDAADGPVFLVAGPAASGNVASVASYCPFSPVRTFTWIPLNPLAVFPEPRAILWV